MLRKIPHLHFSRLLGIMTTEYVDIGAMRKSYKTDQDVLDVATLVAKEPFANFAKWFEDACKLKGPHEPNAMSLATSTRDGKPSVRIVLLKGYDKNGFVFFTDYSGRKAAELVRVEGKVVKTSRDVSERYFTSRPRLSRISASISDQSKVIPNREYLQEKVKDFEAAHLNQDIPTPEKWGGYVLKPEVVEFWQGQDNRLHDRIVFRKPRSDEVIDSTVTHQGEDGWVFERLSP